MDYDVIVRIPIRARDMREAYTEADNIAALDIEGEAEVVKVEPTGASGEET